MRDLVLLIMGLSLIVGVILIALSFFVVGIGIFGINVEVYAKYLIGSFCIITGIIILGMLTISFMDSCSK